METSRHWRLRQQRYALVGEVCGHCDAKNFPPRDICPHCGGEAENHYQFSGRGEVYSFTTVRQAPAGFERIAPYTVALVKLVEGPMVTARLTGLDPNIDPEKQIQIGMPVEMVTIRLREDGDKGMLVYGYGFRQVIEGSVSRERSR